LKGQSKGSLCARTVFETYYYDSKRSRAKHRSVFTVVLRATDLIRYGDAAAWWGPSFIRTGQNSLRLSRSGPSSRGRTQKREPCREPISSASALMARLWQPKPVSHQPKASPIVKAASQHLICDLSPMPMGAY